MNFLAVNLFCCSLAYHSAGIYVGQFTVGCQENTNEQNRRKCLLIFWPKTNNKNTLSDLLVDCLASFLLPKNQWWYIVCGWDLFWELAPMMEYQDLAEEQFSESSELRTVQLMWVLVWGQKPENEQAGRDGVDKGAQVLVARLENLEFWHLKIEDGCLRSNVEWTCLLLIFFLLWAGYWVRWIFCTQTAYWNVHFFWKHSYKI